MTGHDLACTRQVVRGIVGLLQPLSLQAYGVALQASSSLPCPVQTSMDHSQSFGSGWLPTLA